MAETPTTNKIEEKSTFVQIKYRVRILNGRILKGAAEPELMDFITGYAQVVPGLEKRLIGHILGEKMNFTVPPEEAFGERHPELVIEKSKDDFHFPPGYSAFVGMELPMVTEGWGPDTVTIKEIKDETIVIDGNHPLAGAPLQYELEIVEARPAQPTEICSEWEGESEQTSCSGGACELVLGRQEE
jgi:FKBP-type peptidyl-prolyl cis-trans isomerase SlyD